MNLSFVVANAGRTRTEIRDGREYLVAPVTLIVPGVLNGSKGALFYPDDECRATAMEWNHVPLTLYHPSDPINGQHLSAGDDGVLQRQGLGWVQGVDYKDRTRGEAWFDGERTKALNRELYDRIKSGDRVEVSTGLFTDNEVSEGVYKGRPYTHVARNHRPDHLAVLPDQRGACSVSDGCGLNMNATHSHGKRDEERSGLNLVCKTCGKSGPTNPLNKNLKEGEQFKSRCSDCRKNTTHKIVANAWSDAAREASARARQAAGAASAKAMEASAAASGGSKVRGLAQLAGVKSDMAQEEDNPRAAVASHKAAMSAHDDAINHHNTLALRAERSGNIEKANQHYEASDEHGAAYQAHEKAVKLLRGATRNANRSPGGQFGFGKKPKDDEDESDDMGDPNAPDDVSAKKAGPQAVAVNPLTGAPIYAPGKGAGVAANLARAAEAALNAWEDAGGEAAYRFDQDEDDQAVGNNDMRTRTRNEFSSDAERMAAFAQMTKDGTIASGQAEKASSSARRSEGGGRTGEKVAARHEKAADLHQEAARVHKEAGNKAKAAEHKQKAAYHNSKVEEHSGVENRAQLVDSIVANCACDGDRHLLHQMSDAALRQMARNAFKPFKKKDEEDDDEDEDDIEDNDDDLHSFDGRTPTKGGSAQAGGKGTRDEYGSTQNEEQWLASAPPSVREAVRNAMEVQRREKDSLLRQLTANVDPTGRNRVLRHLASKSAADLKDMLLMLPQAHFAGAAGAPGQSFNTEFDRDDVLPLPTIDWKQQAE